MTQRFIRGLSALLVIFVLSFSPLVPPVEYLFAEEVTTPTGQADSAAGQAGNTGTDGSSAGGTTPTSDGTPSITTTGDASSDATAVNQGNVSNTTVDATQPAAPAQGGSTTTESESTDVTSSDTGTATTTQSSQSTTQADGTSSSSDTATTTTTTDDGVTTTTGTTTEEISKPTSTEGGNVGLTTGNDYGATSTATSTAETGSNTTVDPDGAFIFTGAADAVGTLISLFNIAITNSSGNLLLLQNPLGASLDLTQQFLNVFGGSNENSTGCSLLGCSHTNAVFNMITENVAKITNTLVVRSGTGNNAADSDNGASIIDTGNASAFGRVINFGNLQIVNSRYLVILLNNIGDLDGDIVLPPANFFRNLSSGVGIDGGSSIATTNGADVTNNATANADTGSNTAATTEGGVILTGNSTANTDIYNFINENSVGGRPVCFIVSVGGTWNGTVVGLPEGFTREKTQFGEIICGAPGHKQTNLPGNFNATTTNYAKILNNVLVEATTGGNNATGTQSLIKTGDADAFLQILNVVNQNIIGQDWIFALITVTGNWKGDLTFGSDEFWNSLRSTAGNYNYGTRVMYTKPSLLTITKTANVHEVEKPGSVDYTIVVKNEGQGPSYHAQLFDTLLTADDEEVWTKNWWLGDIAAGEEVTVTYTVQFGKEMPAGTYINKAQVKAISGHPSINPFYGTFGHSPVVSETVNVVGPATAEPIVTKPAIQCMPFLTSYLGRGRTNSSLEVKKLQAFLNKHEGFNVEETGVFDTATYDAVKAFQNRYPDNVLQPWGIKAATGYVYYTTQKHINDLVCATVGTQTTFPLSGDQQGEIMTFRERIERARTQRTPEPSIESIGAAAGTPIAATIRNAVAHNATNSPIAEHFAEVGGSAEDLVIDPVAPTLPAAAAAAPVPSAKDVMAPTRSILDTLFKRFQNAITFPLMLNFGKPIARR